MLVVADPYEIKDVVAADVEDRVDCYFDLLVDAEYFDRCERSYPRIL